MIIVLDFFFWYVVESLAEVTWTGNWVSFIDSLMKLQMFSNIKTKCNLLYPSFVRKLLIRCSEFTSTEKGEYIYLCVKVVIKRGVFDELKMRLEKVVFSKFFQLKFIAYVFGRTCMNLGSIHIDSVGQKGSICLLFFLPRSKLI